MANVPRETVSRHEGHPTEVSHGGAAPSLRTPDNGKTVDDASQDGGGATPKTPVQGAPEPDDFDDDDGIITRTGIVRFGSLAGGAATTLAMWPTGPAPSVLLGIVSALATAAALHELLPKRWR
jgi:hypothetical protein